MHNRSMSCACTSKDACQCARSDPSRPPSEDEARSEQALLNRTKALSAWWQTQNETTSLVNGTVELAQWHEHWHGYGGHWHGHGYGGPGWGGPGYGCRGGGGCGCVFILGCFCGHH